MKNILLVSDCEKEKINQNKILFHHGYINVFQASNELQAIELYHEMTPGLVIVRLYVPELQPSKHGFDGLSIVRKLKKIDVNAYIVMTIQYGSHPSIIEAIQCGAKDFIPLPLYEYVFIEVVRKALGRFVG